jgi:hypothetical protein
MPRLATPSPALLSLSDQQLEAVMFFAHPLAPDERSRFLAELAERVAGAGEVGLGLRPNRLRFGEKRVDSALFGPARHFP